MIAIIASILLFASGGACTAISMKRSYSMRNVVIPWLEQILPDRQIGDTNNADDNNVMIINEEHQEIHISTESTDSNSQEVSEGSGSNDLELKQDQVSPEK